jgi:hypothetical protein
LLRLQFACLEAADIKCIVGYVAGDGDDKGVTADNTVGFEANGGNCLLTSTCQLTSPTLAWGKRSKRRAAYPVLFCPGVSAQHFTSVFARPPMIQAPNTSYEFAKHQQNNTA